MDQPKLPSKPVSLAKKILIIILIIIATFIILFIVAAVAGSFKTANISTSKTLSPMGNYGLGLAMDNVGLAPTAGSARQEAGIDYANPAPPTANIQPKVIKTANLSITVDDVDKSAGQINNEAVLNGGFVQNSSVTENERGQKYANLILRVPATNFDSIIVKIKSLAKLVEREDINGREVTEEYVDLQADLTHNQAVEAQYLDLLKRAQQVEEIIAVRDKLDQVQGEIERIKGRLRYLDNQTEMSTIAISISSVSRITLPAEKWQPIAVIKEAVKKTIVSLQNFVNFIILFIFFIISAIPYLLLLLVIYLIGKWIYKKFFKKLK
jgi:hypothetical protein